MQNKYLSNNKSVEFLKTGTIVKVIGDSQAYACIMDDDRESCESDSFDDLNYYIKFCKKDDDYSTILNKLEANNDIWYDEMILWNEVKPID